MRAACGAAVAAAVLALPGLAGCASSATPAPTPVKVVVLSNDTPVAELRRPPATTVELSVHESFAVQYLESDQPRSWVQTTRGSRAVLGRRAPVAVSSCPPQQAGCATTMDAVYVAKARGTTTVVWSFVPMGGCARGTPACETFPRAIRVVVR